MRGEMREKEREKKYHLKKNTTFFILLHTLYVAYDDSLKVCSHKKKNPHHTANYLCLTK